MATTRIIPMDINKGKTIAQRLKARVEYVKNPDKTDGGELISSYACSPETADQEFLLARNEYVAITGRRIHNEVIAYQLRQSFKPGEVTPEEANQIGYELASRFLKGEHAFLVAIHNNTSCVHNHIVFCATALDCTRKFRDVLRSGKALAELSDQICEEHKLSVITEPKNQTVTYDKWLGESAKASQRDILRMTIDAALRMQPDGFDALMQLLEEAGCRIKRDAQISIKPPGAKRFIRLDTVGEEYTEEALRLSLAGKHVHIPKRARCRMTQSQVERLIDIEASRAAEYHYLLSRQKKHKILTREQLKQMNDLEDWLACIDSMLRSLSDDERFVIQRHLVDGIDWNRIIAEYEMKWGAKNGRCRRTLIRYQNSALTKLARRMQEADLPEIK